MERKKTKNKIDMEYISTEHCKNQEINILKIIIN